MIKKIIFTIFFFALISFVTLFIISSRYIGTEVNKQCVYAIETYQQDCVESLLLLVKDNTKGFTKRNSAIWALGQIGDARALPVLTELYTEKIPEKEPLDLSLSQYELKKAIDLCSGEKNITKIFWPKINSL